MSQQQTSQSSGQGLLERVFKLREHGTTVRTEAIAGFTTPAFSLGASFRLLRFVFTILGAVFGLFGVQFALLLAIVHLCSLRSFGMPYLAPFAPLVLADLKDSVVRTWWWGMRSRPKLTGGREPLRQPAGQEPEPGEDPEEDEDS